MWLVSVLLFLVVLLVIIMFGIFDVDVDCEVGKWILVVCFGFVFVILLVFGLILVVVLVVILFKELVIL